MSPRSAIDCTIYDFTEPVDVKGFSNEVVQRRTGEGIELANTQFHRRGEQDGEFRMHPVGPFDEAEPRFARADMIDDEQ